MSNEIILNADLRVRTGTNKTREIRREDSMVPAIIYGNEEESKNIKLKLNELTKRENSKFNFIAIVGNKKIKSRKGWDYFYVD